MWYTPIIEGIVKIDYKDYENMSIEEIMDLNYVINYFKKGGIQMSDRTITYTIRAGRVSVDGFRRTETAITRIARTSSNVSKKVKAHFASMGKSVANTARMMTIAIKALSVAVSGFALKWAKDAEEVENKFRVVFKGMTEEAILIGGNDANIRECQRSKVCGVVGGFLRRRARR